MSPHVPDVSHDVAARAPEVDWREEGGRVVLTKRKMGAVGTRVLRALRLPHTLTIRLDPLGSEAWRLLDGDRTVGEVAEAIQARHPDEEDVPRRLGQFLSTMVSNGLVRLE